MITRTKYKPAEIEKKWQDEWETEGIYYAPDSSPRSKYYNLVMLPYPSGDLHIGHWYNYTGADIYGRFMRMRGYNVTQPIGFDAFGLPAENAAIKRNIQPRTGRWTTSPTCASSSPRWVPAGTGRVRSSPACPTITAGRNGSSCSFTSRPGLSHQGARQLVPHLQHHPGQRAGGQRRLRALRHAGRSRDRPVAAAYHRLRRRTAALRRTGLARKDQSRCRPTGSAAARAPRSASAGPRVGNGKLPHEEIPVFTTRPDTIYGVTFFVLAPEHPLVERLTTPAQRAAVEAYIERCAARLRSSA